MASSIDMTGLDAAVRAHARERAERLGDRFVETARGFAPRRTGAGAESIEVEAIRESSNGFTIHVVVGEPYMVFQNRGTGIYGPNGQPIRARSGGVLAFDSAIGGGMVFAHSVRGTEPTHFWERTLDSWGRIVGDS